MKLAPKFNPSLCVALSLLLSPAALCADYHSPKGYSLTYPSTWLVLPKAQTATIASSAKSSFGSMADVNVDVTVYDPATSGVLLNVSTLPGTAPMTSDLPAGYLVGFKQSLAQGHLKSSNLDCKLAHLGNHTVVRLTGLMESNQPYKRSFQIHQYVISGRTSTYILTGIAPSGSPSNAVFDKLAGSFKVG